MEVQYPRDAHFAKNKLKATDAFGYSRKLEEITFEPSDFQFQLINNKMK